MYKSVGENVIWVFKKTFQNIEYNSRYRDLTHETADSFRYFKGCKKKKMPYPFCYYVKGLPFLLKVYEKFIFSVNKSMFKGKTLNLGAKPLCLKYPNTSGP